MIDIEPSRGNDIKMAKTAFSIALINKEGKLRLSDIEQYLGRAARDMDLPKGLVLYIN